MQFIRFPLLNDGMKRLNGANLLSVFSLHPEEMLSIFPLVAEYSELSRQTMTKKWRIIIALAATLTPAMGWGQSYESDVGEFAGYAGASFGIGAHPVVGASSGLAFARYGMGLIDISYSPLGQTTLRARPGTRIVQNSGLYDFNFKRADPYSLTKAVGSLRIVRTEYPVGQLSPSYGPLRWDDRILDAKRDQFWLPRRRRSALPR
jgi:hypothetical protein